MGIVQNFIYTDNEDFGAREKYIRIEGSVLYDDKIHLQKYSTIQFDTYYNGLSVPLWQNKVELKNISLNISGSGLVEIELLEIYETKLDVNAKGYPRKSISKKIINLNELKNENIFEIDIENKDKYTGLIYPKIKALEDTVIDKLNWSTNDIEKRTVKLGITVTHFNRKNYVLAAIKRIKKELLDKKEWENKIDFIIVDNSKNITLEEADGVKVIPNENTGGSGGFTRGFLYYKNETKATHVLFMDDDASLEVESIKRAYYILSYAMKDNSAVGAALFYDNNPNYLIERGAHLENAGWKPDFPNMGMVNAWDVLISENSKLNDKSYMGWWFAAFPIKYATKLVPPYFVRGDDVSFSQMNNFNIIYGNGIACYAESFSTKVASMTTYLDTLNPFIVNAIFNTKKSHMILQLKKLYIKRYLEQIISGRYGYADVMRLSLKKFRQLTVEEFIKSIDISKIIPSLKELTKNNTLKDIDLDKLNVINNEVEYESKKNKIKRLITFNKIFLPLNKNEIVKQDFIYRAHFRDIAGYKNVLYYDENSKKGFTVTISRLKTIKYLMLLLIDSVRYIFTYKSVQKRLLKQYDYLTSEKMWNEILKLEQNK